jgi:hypothetical protein
VSGAYADADLVDEFALDHEGRIRRVTFQSLHNLPGALTG